MDGSDDRDWMYNAPRWSDEYIERINEFLNKAFEKGAVGEQICCPCRDCCNRYWYQRNVVYNHLISRGFVKAYYRWIFHGERLQSSMHEDIINDNEKRNDLIHDDIHGLLHDAFREVAEGLKQNLTEDVKKFYKLVEEGQQELYPGCKTFSKLSFLIRLYLFKCMNHINNAAFGDLLNLLKEAIPEIKLPGSFNEAKKTLSNLGLDYVKIHACPNDCLLFWKDQERANSCYVCGASRWKMVKDDKGNDISSSASGHSIPAKVLRHFPLKTRLQRMFMCSETANSMRWHAEGRPKDGHLRNPADGEVWQVLDSLNDDFAKDPRNVRLGLTSDGFNPFRTMSVAHSTWPIVLINYNLPPWMGLKSEYFMLSLLISGPRSPGNDIDVYLQPLTEELKEFWEVGMETYDASKNELFKMHAALLWTVSDFPAYAMLSGWSTKGKLACPHCHYGTCLNYLKHSRKTVYHGSHMHLDKDHKWRHDRKSFNGETEFRVAPTSLLGTQILEELCNFGNIFGKKKKKNKADRSGPWKKRSIFFELPYWEYNPCRHTLDLMHIEKNICDNLIGTLLDIPGRTKDHLRGRLDMQEEGVRPKLHPIPSNGHRQVKLAKACFSMTSREKEIFCSVVKGVKVPQGSASNIARCVQVQERKISGYKTHDAHFFLHYLLQVAVRRTLPKFVALPLIRLGAFFRAICCKVLKCEDLPYLQNEIVETLCQLERIFPPSFFDIMVHLPIHLVHQIKLAGPVHYHWMYPVERYLCLLKSYVRNRGRPEASIAEAYIAEECLIFCSRYLHDGVKTRLNRSVYHGKDIAREESFPICSKIGHPIGGKKRKKGKAFTLDSDLWVQAHRYVLFNSSSTEVERYIMEHLNLIDNQRKRSRWARAQGHSKEFMHWFRDKVEFEGAADSLKWLSKGPNYVAKKFTGYFINGYRFHTMERDGRCKTQNSGVTLTALTPSFASSRDDNPILGYVTYNGSIQNIIEIDYWGQFKVVLFKCGWFWVEKDDYGLTRVDFTNLHYSDDPFVLTSHVHQVFYVADPVEEGWYYVMKRIPRDQFDFEPWANVDVASSYWSDPEDSETEFSSTRSIDDDDEISWSREDIPETIHDLHFDICDEELNDATDSDIDDIDWEWMESNA